jgi:hypothetical protein
MMSIPLSQFERLLAVPPAESGLDYHAIRLIMALLKHGLRQERSPKLFCELPSSVNAEFGDYLSLALSSKLGLLSPDRLDDMLTGDIHSSCQNAWDEIDPQPKLGFLDSVKSILFGIFNSNR